MKKEKILKGILLMVVSVGLLATSNVYAATTGSLDDELNNDKETDLTTSSKSDNTNTNTNTNKSNTNANKANTNANKTNNASVYNNTNNTNLPKTGAEDSLPTMVLVVVFGISSVYAYRKIKEYKNI